MKGMASSEGLEARPFRTRSSKSGVLGVAKEAVGGRLELIEY